MGVGEASRKREASARRLWTILVRTQRECRRKVGILKEVGDIAQEWETHTLNDSESLGEQAMVGPKDRTSCQVTRAGPLANPLVK